MTDDIEAMMSAWRIDRFGGPDALRNETIPAPRPARGEVLLKVQSAGLNPVDLKTREGRYPLIRADALPFTLGRDVAGVVAQCGEGVEGWARGVTAYAFVGQGQGAFADYVAVSAAALSKPPATLSLADAGAVPLAALTAWQGLFDHGKLERGERVLIHGASGGVGQFAVQFARECGAHVYATGSGESLNLLKALGAAHTIDYRKDRFEDVAKDIDLVYDLIGGDTQQRSWSVLRPGGALVSTLNEPSQVEASKHGARATRYTARPDGGQLARIAQWIDRRAVRVEIVARYPFARLPDAFERLAQGHLRGKVVVTRDA
ncbi:NADP-dependent oxidoreductase [Paraburkholderia caballeronis]|uniref:NADPH:quinone reductase n=1 Tax=Paraburkholderia caballeronis TaxID=416943 RepID=A0A1H7J5U9_9BURK|nr:NADP-dependent oxidoreductase [Paraburkholderia caballeronis]PXW27573.1 NADPH:quinone reductase-like Zn-dependent oxidoreductase [Paraburkholderia caballeronis]PXX03047.1 NADPH:quinone reductase-like Zn-dependent oxidoreductase [Paraburkholderia caballeronis]RAK03772.1 NADPH:quinone reductase-like Zn-dependent oxidoreductase [Paraburkholderia caballeronis]TDV21055.1 NADPH:quinone reductase-like Zn-dependent oxidoreductase [Paraburkholderia caballeronis]TDV21484.1 NADPH:quinone reductase-lik